MDKRLVFLIPITAVAMVLLIGGIYRANASSEGDFNVTGGVLHSYNGTASKVTIPSTVETVGRDAFLGNNIIEEVYFSDSVDKIDENAFKDCKALKKVVIPDSVATMGDSAFWGCSALSSVDIGVGLKNFGNGAFSDCDSLQSINISADNPYLTTVGSAVFNKGGTKLYQFAAGSPSGAYGIPENVEDIARYAFWGCDNLKSVTINGIKKIPNYAFSNCPALVNVSMQIPTYEIGIGAFSGCSSLSQVIIPESVGRIHETAFDGCPEQMYIICDTYSFAQRYADEHFYPVSQTPVFAVNALQYEEAAVAAADDTPQQDTAQPPVTADSNVINGNAPIYTQPDPEVHDSLRVTAEGVILGNSPVVSDKAYVQIDASDFNVVDPNNLPKTTTNAISDHAHYLDQTLTDFDFAPGLNSIGDFAFARTHLGSAVLPEGTRSIGEGAFYHCDMLYNVSIPSSVEHIGKNAFNFTPWYNNWMENAAEGDVLVVGDGVLIGIKGERPEVLPAYIKSVADGVLE